MKEGIQTFLLEAGEAGCYALSIIKIAERVTKKHIDVVDALELGISRGFIYYNERSQADNDNFYVNNPADFLGILTGDQWLVNYASASYKEMPEEYIVDRWERSRTGVTTAHFRLPDWDGLTDSQSVKYGKIASKRVFRRI